MQYRPIDSAWNHNTEDSEIRRDDTDRRHEETPSGEADKIGLMEVVFRCSYGDAVTVDALQLQISEEDRRHFLSAVAIVALMQRPGL